MGQISRQFIIKLPQILGLICCLIPSGGRLFGAQTPSQVQTYEAVKKFFDAGNQYYSQSNYAAAIEQYRKAIELDDSQELIFHNLAVALYNQGSIKYNAEAKAEARTIFIDSVNAARKMVKLKSDDPAYRELLLRSLAVLVSRYGDQSFAKETDTNYEELIQLYLKDQNKPAAANAYAKYGDYLLVSGKPESLKEASKAYGNSLALNASSASAMIGQSVIQASAADATLSSLEKAYEQLMAVEKNLAANSPDFTKAENYASCLRTAISELKKPIYKIPEGGILGGVPDKPKTDATGKTLESVIKGSAIHMEQPVYPSVARAARVEGKIEVDILIDETGKVVSTIARNGQILLQATATKAARACVFHPTMLDGKPVFVQGVLTFNFAP